MLKQSPSRNHRSRGIRVKNVLQICVLLAVCLWLIYQVKHSHDKKKAFDESDAKTSLNTHVHDVSLKPGRKELLPRFGDTPLENENHVEEAEEEVTAEEDDESDKHEEEEQEEDNKSEEKEEEEEGRGGGDDEIDENDLDKSEVEAEHEEEFADGEKEREEGDDRETEEKYAEDKEGQVEDEGSSEDHDHDGGSGNTHEAREEHYKADDASSAVTHDTQSLNTEMEDGNSENSSESTENNILEEESKLNNTEKIGMGRSTADVKAGEGEMSPNVTGKEEKGLQIVSSKSQDSPVLNSTMRIESNSQTVGNNSTEGNYDGSNSQTVARGLDNNSQAASNKNQSGSDSLTSHNSENAEAEMGGSSNSSTTELAVSQKVEASNVTVEAGGHSGTLTTEETNESAQNELDAGNGIDESSGLNFKTENEEEVQHDPIDSSDSSISVEEKEIRTDLDTLPEIRTEGSNNEDAAAE